jgi:hypothetical protein
MRLIAVTLCATSPSLLPCALCHRRPVCRVTVALRALKMLRIQSLFLPPPETQTKRRQ